MQNRGNKSNYTYTVYQLLKKPCSYHGHYLYAIVHYIVYVQVCSCSIQEGKKQSPDLQLAVRVLEVSRVLRKFEVVGNGMGFSK